ncbi:MAG: hypothetical protein ABFC94_11120 [Syntrophomonas sp.]
MRSFIKQDRKEMYCINLLAIIVGSCIVPLLKTGVTLPVIVTFIAWLVFLNLLPGLGVWGLIGRTIGSGSAFVMALALGVTYNIICYLVGLMASAFWLYIVLVSLLAAAGMYFVFSYLRDAKNRHLFRKIPLADFCVLAILILMTNTILYYNYYLSTPLPGKVDIEYYLDIPWHLGNIAALSLNWFPQDFRLAGYPFHYHFMAYAWMAALKSCHFSSAMILLRLYPAFFLNLLLLLVWYTGKVLFSRTAAVGAVILFLMAGNFWSFKPYNLFLNNLMFSPTYLLAMVLMLYLIVEIYWYLTLVHINKSHIRRIAVIIPLMAVLAGAKGPFLPVVIAGILSLMILIKRIRTKTAVLFGAGVLIFVLAYLVIYRSGGAADLGITTGQLIYNTAVYKDSYGWFHSKGLTYAGPLAVIIYLVAFLGIKWAALVFCMARLRDKNRQIQYTLLLGMAVAGMTLGYLLQARDNSQYYFLFAGMIAINLLTADFLAEFYKPGPNRARGLLISFLILAAMVPSFKDTYQMIGKNMHDTAQRQMLTTKALTPELYEGLVFLSKNTSPQDLVVGRRFSNTAGRRIWFYYSAFSERRFLLEGWEFMPSNRTTEVEKRYQDIVRLYKTKSVIEARDILSRYHIDYMIADKKYRSTCPHFPHQGIITPIFTNEKVIIYKVHNRKTN